MLPVCCHLIQKKPINKGRLSSSGRATHSYIYNKETIYSTSIVVFILKIVSKPLFFYKKMVAKTFPEKKCCHCVASFSTKGTGSFPQKKEVVCPPPEEKLSHANVSHTINV